MRWGIVAAGALLTVCSAAEAADLGAAPAPVLRSWDGLYLGLHGGFAGGEFKYPGNFSVEGSIVASGDMTLNSSGLYGGGQIGYNFQPAPSWLLGVEADISAADINGKLSASGSIPSGAGSASGGSNVDWFGTLRGRVGWVNGPVLLYGTAGLAFGETKSSYDVSATGFSGVSGSKSDTSYGWTAGGGIEYAVTPAISLKTEYKYVDLGSSNLLNYAFGADEVVKIDAETRFHTFEVGLNYRFGAEGTFAPPPPTDWRGFYVGVQGGLGGDEFVHSASYANGGTTLASGDASLDSSGFFGGVQAGYNFPTAPNWLVGIEGDIAAADIDGKLSIDAASGGFGGAVSAGSKVDWFGTLRGRLGWVYGPLLVYGTGGLAYGQTTSSLDLSIGGFGGGLSTSKTNVGWTAGAGFEYALAANVSLKTEYKYVDLGSADLLTVNLSSLGTLNVSEETKFHTVQVGLNYRF